jgi:hypothetical protein
MRIFKERNFVYKLIFIGALFVFIFFLPITPLPAAMRKNLLGTILVLSIFALVLFQQFRIGLTKYIINEKKEFVITFRNKPKFTETINKITSVSDYNEMSWGRRRSLFKAPKSKFHLIDGRNIPIYTELRDENDQSLLDVLKSEYKIIEKLD